MAYMILLIPGYVKLIFKMNKKDWMNSGPSWLQVGWPFFSRKNTTSSLLLRWCKSPSLWSGWQVGDILSQFVFWDLQGLEASWNHHLSFCVRWASAQKCWLHNWADLAHTTCGLLASQSEVSSQGCGCATHVMTLTPCPILRHMPSQERAGAWTPYPNSKRATANMYWVSNSATKKNMQSIYVFLYLKSIYVFFDCMRSRECKSIGIYDTCWFTPWFTILVCRQPALSNRTPKQWQKVGNPDWAENLLDGHKDHHHHMAG